MKNDRHGQSAIITVQQKNKIRQFLPPQTRLIFDLAWYTGERWGAIIQLKVTDVYQYNNTPLEAITFRAATRKKDTKGKAKTRQVPVHPVLKELLIAYPVPDTEYLFPSPVKPETYITFSAVDYAFRDAVGKAGLTAKGISTHSTRRTFITKLYEAGVSLYEIRRITGHQSFESLALYIEGNDRAISSAILNID